MTRTTELLKEIGNFKRQFVEEHIKNACKKNLDVLRRINLCKSELRGRLDALKEKEKFLDEIWCIKNSPTWKFHIEQKLASIQEEIKLIETAGVGK